MLQASTRELGDPDPFLLFLDHSAPEIKVLLVSDRTLGVMR